MGRLAEIPCHDSLHRPSVTARSFQIFCHLILCPNSSHFYSQASFHFHRILYLPWEEENITKTIQRYIFLKPKKDGRTSNHQCNLRRIDEALALENEATSAPEMFTEGGVFRDCSVHCLPLRDKETEAQKVGDWPEAPQTGRGGQGGELRVWPVPFSTHHSNSAILCN